MSIVELIFKFISPKCPSCSYKIRIEDVKRAQVSKSNACPACGFDFSKRNLQKFNKLDSKATPQVKVNRKSNQFQIDIRWLSPASSHIIFIALTWNSFIGSVLFLFLKYPENVQNAQIAYPVIGFFGLIGLFLLFAAIQEILNTTSLIFKNERLVVLTSPLATQKIQSFNQNEISNISVSREISGSTTSIGKSQKIFRHNLFINFKNGQRKALCRVQDLNEAAYVEKLIEDHLNLKDDPKLDKIS